MDFHALQNKLFQIDPTDPKEDLAKLQAQAANPQEGVTPAKDYLQESVNVAKGTMPVEGNYSLNDFAALAGVIVNESQKTGSSGQAKGKDSMPSAEPGRTKHPLKDKLVGEDDGGLMRGIQRTRKDVADKTSVQMIQLSLQRAVAGQVLTPQQREALGPYVEALIKILSEPRFATIFDNIVKMANKKEDEETNESGLQYYTGVKKHGKEYMKKAAAAGRDGASQEELGRLKDKYSKAEKNKKTESISERLRRELDEFSKSRT
tara:strand:+ start:931 stop:1716 length:786 start_codon:yes stop_codon:yes gene_type:complete